MKQDIEGLRFWWRPCESIPGTMEAHAIVPMMPHPVCTLYFSYGPGPDVMHVLDVFTNRRYRNRGIAKKLIQAVIDAVEPRYVVTGSKSSRPGTALMLSLGATRPEDGVMKDHLVIEVGK